VPNTCDRCDIEFKKLDSTVSRSGHGTRDSWELCRSCKKEFMNMMTDFVADNSLKDDTGDTE